MRTLEISREDWTTDETQNVQSSLQTQTNLFYETSCFAIKKNVHTRILSCELYLKTNGITVADAIWAY